MAGDHVGKSAELQAAGYLGLITCGFAIAKTADRSLVGFQFGSIHHPEVDFTHRSYLGQRMAGIEENSFLLATGIEFLLK